MTLVHCDDRYIISNVPVPGHDPLEMLNMENALHLHWKCFYMSKRHKNTGKKHTLTFERSLVITLINDTFIM